MAGNTTSAALTSLCALFAACSVDAVPRDDGVGVDELAMRCARAMPSRGLSLELCGAELLVDGERFATGPERVLVALDLARSLCRARLANVRIPASPSAAELLALARAVVADGMPPASFTLVRDEPFEGDVRSPTGPPVVAEPVHAVDRPAVAAAEPDSRLRSLFLQHRLITELPPLAGLDPQLGKLVVQGIVDRLLGVHGGLEPLMLLQQDEALLRRSTVVAVLAVAIARECGWPADRLVDIGVAALLQGIGVLLDADSPGPAAFTWLLERGEQDVWLRCALVARDQPEFDGAQARESNALGVAEVVRVAVAAAGCSGDAAAWRAFWRDVAGRADLSPGVVAAARTALHA